ncbi:DUF1929 domain-containing protein [candidate division TA06 bacterium]|nr:DUF1929 domain-containing protein [candidate division TA06 bacterium]
MAGLQDTLGTNASIPEIYDMITDTWIELPNAQIDLPLYPFMFLLPDGDVFAAGPSPFSFSLNLSTESWSFVDFSPYFAGSAVMYESGKFLKSGGDTISVGISEAVNWTQVIDMNEPSPAWRGVDSMAYSRRNHNLTVLPDGKVLVTGGTVLYDTVTFAVFAAELWDPSTETWTTMAGMAEPRMYHSSALLLPDGRVFSAGGDNYSTAEIFSPPYLFKGSRPTITSVPSAVEYDDTIFVETPDGPDISSVSLIRPSAVTHSFNQDQRYMSLTFSQTAGGLNVVTPANANLAPPGYYMLFLVNSTGVPSTAEFVHLGGIPPVVVEAVASDESIPIGIDDDDVVLIRFDKPMNKPPIDALNINNILMLSNGHSWLDGFGDIGGAVWNPLGDMLAITLSTQFGLPTVAVGDSITPDGVTITDLLGNPANSPIEITGSFDPPLGVEERGDLLPKTFALFQNSPNPFSRGTAIHFSLSKKSHTHITIYDVAGKAVATLVDEDLMAGYHSILWNAPVSSGVYFYRIKAGDFVSTRKMVLLR